MATARGCDMAQEIEFRLAGPDDAEPIRALTRAAYARWVALIGREPAPMTADYEAAVRAHRFDLLYVEGELAGLVETVDEVDCLLVENVAVAPDRQGEGLGRILMGRAEEVARELGRPGLRLFTNRLMAANIRLYERLGYRTDGEEDLGFAVRVNMSKRL